MFGIYLCIIPYILSILPYSTSYDIVRDYSGSTFFDLWDFYGSWDNLTLGTCINVLSFLASDPIFFKGDVWWLDRTSAFQENLAYINENNQTVIKVDNVSNVPYNEKRNTVFHNSPPPPRLDFDLTSDPNYISTLLRCWQSLDYRFDPSSVRVLGIYPCLSGCVVS